MTQTTTTRILRTTTGVLGAVGIVGSAVFLGAGVASASGLDDYVEVSNPGDYAATGMDRYGWAFFQTPDGRMCGIGPNSGPVGCDAVPYDAAGVNQTIIEAGSAATLINSPTPTFTQAGGQTILPEGHKLSHRGATCGVGYQGTVTCEMYGNGFTLSATYVDLH